jgi:16S rRNA (guanine527-N7)-methyltransferase
MKHAGSEALAAVCARYQLDMRQEGQLHALLDGLAARSYAQTAVREHTQAVNVHLADALSALELDLFEGARAIVDLGSGVGFPGLPLAIAMPGRRFVLLDSQRKRVDLMAALIRESGLANAQPVHGRVEEWTAGRDANDVALARALGPPALVLEYASPLLRQGGALVEWRGRRDREGERRALAAASQLGLEPVEVKRVEPFAGARDHHLHVYSKVRVTPAGFPRRPGVARKRPLGERSDRSRR